MVVSRDKSTVYYAHIKKIRRRRRRRDLLLIQLKKNKAKVVLRRTHIRVEKTKITPKEGLAVLVGTQIGAGVLGLPYAASKVGLIPAVLILFGVMLLMLFTALIILDMSRDMNGAQMSTITQRVMGRTGGWIMYVSITIMSFGALLAYIAGMGCVFSQLFGIGETAGGLIFWIFASLIIYRGIKSSSKAELLMYYVMLALFLGVTGILIPDAKISNATYVNLSGTLSLMGIAIFSLGCHTVIPDVYKAIGNYKKTRKVVVLAFIIPTVIYAIFMTAFLLIFGRNTPQIATQGLAEIYGYTGFLVGNIIPLFAITTSYIGIGLAQQSNTMEFLGFRKSISWSIATIPSLLVYVAGMKNFVDVLAFAGDTGDMMSFIILPIALLIIRWYRKDKYSA